MRHDPVLGAVVKRIGPCGLSGRLRSDHLSALAAAIISQQLSAKAAATIFQRFLALFPDSAIPDAAAIAAIDDATLRGVGFSGQKVRYMRDLCAHIRDGRLQLDELGDLTDEAVIEQLTAVTGFGRWSAEMYLMFRLNRPDVFPVGDLGIVKGVQALFEMKRRPAPRTMMRLAEPWRPYRTVAAWYLWRINERP